MKILVCFLYVVFIYSISEAKNLKIENHKINSSTVKHTTLTTAQFAITKPITLINYGNAPINTKDITPPCGATSVDLSTGITSNTTGLALTFYDDFSLLNPISNIVTTQGTYYVKAVSSASFSSASIVVNSFRTNPMVSTQSITPLCGATSVDLNTGITSSTNGLTVNYYANASLTKPVSNLVNTSGVYYLNFTTASGCSEKVTINVGDFNSVPSVEPIEGGPIVCKGQTILLKDKTLNGVWSSANNAIATISKIGLINGVSVGSVKMNYTVSNSCGSTVNSTLITVSGSKPQTTVVTSSPTCLYPLSGNIFVNATGVESPYQFTIDTFNSRQYVVPFKVINLLKGTYKIYLTNNNNCVVDSVVSTLNITSTRDCDSLYVPTGFFPEQAGKNSGLKPFGGALVKDVYFKVYNRYGTLMFESRDIYNAWDGKLNGKVQEAGTYIWSLKYTTVNDRIVTQSGTTVLIR